MFKLSIFAMTLTVGLCPFFSGCTRTNTTAEMPEEALAAAIKLLEAKDRSGFVKRFMPPAKLEELKQRHETADVEQIANAIVGDRTENLLHNYEIVKDAKPDFNEKRTEATFRARGADGKSVAVKFKLIDGKWYLF